LPNTTDPIVYELKMSGTVLGQEMINTFYYSGSTASIDDAALFGSFNSIVLGMIQLTQNSAAEWTRCDITQVKGGATFSSFSFAIPGLVGGDCLPPYAAWSFTKVRGAARERNGYLRIAGVPESYQQNGVVTGTGITATQAVADGLNNPISDGVTDYILRIPRDKVNRVPVTPQQYWNTSGVVYSKIGTQNSRKFGHGR